MAKHVFNKADLFDTVEVGEHSFDINLNDEKVRNFRALALDYSERAQAIAKIDTTKLNETEIVDLEKEASDLLQNVIDQILGAGSFETIYKELGENTFNVAKFVEYLFEILEEKLKESKLIAAQKYTQKNKADALIAKKKAGR